MRTWRGRLAAAAALAVAAGVLFTLGYDSYARRLLMNPSDAALAARWRAHRAEFEELKEIEHLHLRSMGFRLTPEDSARQLSAIARSDPRWRPLVRRLGLDGAHRPESDSVMYFAAAAGYARARWDDVKGFAYSPRPPAAVVADLDRVIVPARERGDVLRWHRALEADWYLFREIGGGDHR